MANTLPLFGSAPVASEPKVTFIPRYGVRLVRESQVLYDNKKITVAADICSICNTIGLPDLPHEELHVFFLSTKNYITGTQLVSRGTLNASLIHPREVFRGAILANANAIILVHNHPSGNPEPSNADKQVTKQIRSSADIIGIELLDHVIIGSNGNHFSFRQEGLFN
ncbi:JAB domain-containing protein [Chlorobium phaeobacteroides]|uniref:DNA repair protein RadC n=1 Tax=Chlorobium phaeobacteroides (strain DSM 266 / SMG 266 / 2430) TaxID=290317 RepID=A1BGW3_CHLPD|nr:JAB domain-containing protein [Chlorobium phaeobacteroides]ABL65640.1 DNA repair protein RadC [Chlorobium phaeobacteroides DSM 266]